MLSEVVGQFVDRQRWLDGVADVLEQVASATFDHLGPLSKPLEDLLHGTPAGHPVHAALTDIPIGSWTATLALDMAGIEDGADLALDVGLVGAISAALVGLVDWRYTTGSQRRRGVAHALFNGSGTLLYGLSSFQRHRGGRAGATTLSNLGYICILCGGYIGGGFVFQLWVIVGCYSSLMGKSPYTAVMPLGGLEEDKPTPARVDNQELVLVRRGDNV